MRAPASRPGRVAGEAGPGQTRLGLGGHKVPTHIQSLSVATCAPSEGRRDRGSPRGLSALPADLKVKKNTNNFMLFSDTY